MDAWNKMIAMEIWEDMAEPRIYIEGRADSTFLQIGYGQMEKEDLVTVNQKVC